MRIFIPGNVPSLKNSKQIIQIPIKGGCGKKRPMLTSSKSVKAYERNTLMYWKINASKFREEAKWHQGKPLNVAFKFLRGSKHKFDYTNALDTVQDLMVRYGWIPDDNADEILPVIKPYEYNKSTPGVLIWIESTLEK